MLNMPVDEDDGYADESVGGGHGSGGDCGGGDVVVTLVVM